MRCSAAYGERWDSELRDRGKDRHHFYFRMFAPFFQYCIIFAGAQPGKFFPPQYWTFAIEF